MSQSSLDAQAKLAGLKAGDIIATINATNGDESISITYFKSASVARDYWNSNKEDLENMQEKDDNIVVKRSGSIIYSANQNKIIGVLIGAFASSSGISLGGINPRELHQTTQCLSAEYIKKMIGE